MKIDYFPTAIVTIRTCSLRLKSTLHVSLFNILTIHPHGINIKVNQYNALKLNLFYLFTTLNHLNVITLINRINCTISNPRGKLINY